MDTVTASIKQHLTVSALAKSANVSRDQVRYYTRIGLLNPVRNQNNGYKLYSPEDITRMLFILKAKNLGYTLKEIEQILSHTHKGHSPCPMVRDIIEERIEANRRKLDELMELQLRMEKAASVWKKLPDKVPDGDSICHLIESFVHE